MKKGRFETVPALSQYKDNTFSGEKQEMLKSRGDRNTPRRAGMVHPAVAATVRAGGRPLPQGYKNGCTDDVMKLRAKIGFECCPAFVIRPYVSKTRISARHWSGKLFSVFQFN